MTNQPEPNAAPDLFGNIPEADRRAVLDTFGAMLMHTRDAAIQTWDGILAGGTYPPWERLLRKHPDIGERCREVISEAIPHIVDTFMYCLLSNLDGPDQSVQVSVAFRNAMVANIARLSWGLPAEPTGNDGWLVRFSKERFEQPY